MGRDREPKYRVLVAVIVLVAVSISFFLLTQTGFSGDLTASGLLRMDWWSDFWNWVGGGLNAIGNAIMGGLQWFWDNVICNVFTFGLSSALKNFSNIYRPLIIDLPPITGSLSDLYFKMRDFSFILLGALIAFAGVCYGLESFRLISEGTAFRILTSSMFSLILIYLIPDLYWALYSGIYSLNSWLFGVAYAGNQNAPPAVVTLCNTAAGIGGVPILGVIVTSIVICTLFVLGAMRYVVFSLIIAMIPFALILRLFPLTERIGNDIIQAFVGFIIASIMSTLAIQIGADLLSIYSWSSAQAQLLAAGVLLAGALLPSMLIPTLGGLFTAGGIAGTAAGAATGQILAQSQLGAYSAIAGAGGGVAGAAMARGAAGEVTGGAGFADRAKLALGGFLYGAARGAIYGAAGVAGKGWMGGAAGIAPAIEQVEKDMAAKLTNTVSTNTGHLTDYLAYNPIAPDRPNAAALGRSFKNEVLEMPPEEAGRLILNYTGLDKSSALMSEESRKRIGSAFQSKISELDDVRAHRVKLGLEKYKAMKVMGKIEECDALVRNAKEFAKKRAEQIEKIQPPSPEFEKPKL